MGRAIDLFVTYRFLKILVTPFEKQEAYKLGIIDKDGNRTLEPGTTNKPTYLGTAKEKNSYTVLHKLVFNIKKIFAKVPGLRTKLGTYAAALFLLKDTFKEDVDPKMWEQEFMKYLKENNIELDNTISEEVTLENGQLPKGIYKLINDITFDTEDVDTDSAFASNKFTVPTGKGGLYKFDVVTRVDSGSNSNLGSAIGYLYKNGTAQHIVFNDYAANYTNSISLNINSILNLSEGDYIEVYVACNTVDNGDATVTHNKYSIFSGHKLIS